MTELVCIVCPRGCRLTVDEANGYAVTGNACPRGAEYGKKELLAPERTLTSVVKIKGALYPCCPVKTSAPVPKRMIPEAMELLRGVELVSPVEAGSTVSVIPGTGAAWITTRKM